MASDDDQETVYCICREPYDGERFMIECDVCKDWFHGSCVGVQETQAVDIEIYHCPNCQMKHGPLVLRKRRQSHRHDYSEENTVARAFQTGSLMFVQELKSRTFPCADEAILNMRDGHGLTLNYIEENGFTVPILVSNKDGLNIKVPPPNFSIRDVEDHVGSMREIDVIDVAKQEDYRMLMREWTEYYNNTNRDKVLNVISLEFTKTKLAEIVEPPLLVRQMSWTTNLWPKTAHNEKDDQGQDLHEKPCVQRYCLMGVKDSYTDFHIDFGGTSVWYHVLKGEKVFYLIEPSTANLGLYEAWLSASNQGGMFFGDQVQHCYKCVVRQGQTLFIPTGWIHAVLTPIDSLVFGGNFLHNFNIDLQIQIYEMEKRVKTPERYMFPNYETLHWFAAKHIYQEIGDFLDNEEPPPSYLVSGAKSLVSSLKSWTHKRDYIKRDAIPESIQYGKLLKDLQKQLRQLGKPSPPKVSNPKKRKWKDDPGDSSDAKEIKVEDTDSSREDIVVKEETDVKLEKDNKPPTSSSHSFFNLQTPTHTLSSPNTLEVKEEKRSPTSGHSEKSPSRLSSAQPTPTTSESSASVVTTSLSSSSTKLTFRLPKAGAYTGGTDLSVYDFDGEEKSSSKSGGAIKVESDVDVVSGGSSPPPHVAVSPPKKAKISSATSASETSSSASEISSPEHKLKLKIPAGRVSSKKSPRSDDDNQLPVASTSAESSKESGKDSSDDDDNDDDDQLVVDENPKRKSQAVQGSLKLKLSVHKSQVKEPSSFDTSHDSSYTTAASVSTSSSHMSDIDAVLPDHNYTVPKSSKRKQKLLHKQHSSNNNNSSSQTAAGESLNDLIPADAVLPAETAQRLEEINKASPSMRDAIQGMLSMSQMTPIITTSTLQKNSGTSPFLLDRDKSKATLRLERENKAKKYLAEDTGETKLATAFKDDEFVYPCLEGSDQDDEKPIFKPRGKQKKDETWNPKVKIQSSIPPMDRPGRPLAKKESVESQLEDAAAKMANKPFAKREYVRKKVKPCKPVLDPVPSTSRGYMGFASTSSDSVDIFGGKLAINQGPTSSKNAEKSGSVKKGKKGLSTAKQRLGKILKLHRM